MMASKAEQMGRASNGRFKKGGSVGNPKGRPKGSTNKIPLKDFKEALSKVEKEKGKTLMKHFIERAFEEDAVMVSAIKKLLPDLKSIDIQGTVDGEHRIILKRK